MARILVVDDEPVSVQLLSRVLKVHGHETLNASTPEEALEVAVRDKPEVILLDWMLPGMDGIDLLGRLRSLPGGDRWRIVMITAGGEADLAERVREAGGDGFLQKPISIDQLAEVIETQLRAVEAARAA